MIRQDSSKKEKNASTAERSEDRFPMRASEYRTPAHRRKTPAQSTGGGVPAAKKKSY
ncbi:hypothetical protein [Crystallibacter degradans]|uniref:hypothetical protein n=1 Tax=Crystallibacter degradans TaxID=2726743 RepID=UPI0014754ADC|nr:hypothetical protein [Arthrobacter sp. SF27]NMR31914.1 hypothetical protein [Arthrobacter sp. SF27]